MFDPEASLKKLPPDPRCALFIRDLQDSFSVQWIAQLYVGKNFPNDPTFKIKYGHMQDQLFTYKWEQGKDDKEIGTFTSA